MAASGTMAGFSQWAEAWVTARVYSNGLPSSARLRPRTEQEQVLYWGCRAAEPIRWKWMSGCHSPAGLQPTLGWCLACTQGRRKGHVSLNGGDDSDPNSPLPANDRSDTVNLPGPRVPRQGLYTICPLCGCGEAGAEHISIFCRAVSDAWAILGPAETDWWLDTPIEMNSELQLAFNHTVAWLSCALAQTPLDCHRRGSEMILRHMASRRNVDELDNARWRNQNDYPECDEVHAWELPYVPSALDPCQLCPNGECKVASFGGKHANRAALADNREQTLALRVTEDVPNGLTLISLRAGHFPAAWPRCDHAVFGWPFTCSLADTNCVWNASRCAHCGTHNLTATCNLKTGDLLRPENPPGVLRPPEKPGILLSFDGGARTQGNGLKMDEGEPPIAGAGAVIWEEADANGRRRCLAQLVIAAPRLRSSMLAEAAGLAYGILFLASACGWRGRIGILGDNLPIMRLAAGNAKLRSDPVWREVEEALMIIARRRWRPDYHAVRRHLNKAADALATLGVFKALELESKGHNGDEIRLWCDMIAFRQRCWTVPTALPGRPATKIDYVSSPHTEAFPG